MVTSIISSVVHPMLRVLTLIASPSVKKANFTGSSTVGRTIGQLPAEYMRPDLLALDGKAPVMICEDADLKLAAEQYVPGAFMNVG